MCVCARACAAVPGLSTLCVLLRSCRHPLATARRTWKLHGHLFTAVWALRSQPGLCMCLNSTSCSRATRAQCPTPLLLSASLCCHPLRCLRRSGSATLPFFAVATMWMPLTRCCDKVACRFASLLGVLLFLARELQCPLLHVYVCLCCRCCGVVPVSQAVSWRPGALRCRSGGLLLRCSPRKTTSPLMTRWRVQLQSLLPL